MNAHRVETVISQDRAVILKDLPFRVGELVEVIILQCPSKRSEKEQYPLRGTPITSALLSLQRKRIGGR